MNKLIIPSILAIIAITMVMAPTFAHAQEGAKPTTSKCKTSVLVKATGTVNGTEYIATILEKSISKTADSDVTAFKFMFGKDKKEKVVDDDATTADAKKPKPPTVTGICPAPGSELSGDVNGITFDTTIPAKGKATVSVDVSSVTPEEPTDPVDPLPNGTDTNSTI